jgi:hypothetical protein
MSLFDITDRLFVLRRVIKSRLFAANVRGGRSGHLNLAATTLLRIMYIMLNSVSVAWMHGSTRANAMA